MKPARGPRQGLVRGRRHEVAVRHRVRVQPGRNEPREMRHVAQEKRPGLVGDRTEPVRLDHARVRRSSAHDQLRPVLERKAPDLLEVDQAGFTLDAVRDDRVQMTREVDLVPVGQMAAVIEAHREHRVAGLERREVDGHVRLRAGVRLDVRMLRPEEALRPLDGQGLDLVDHLAAAVVPLARVALRVLVRRHRPDGLEHARPREVLRGDELDLAALALELASHEARNLRVDLRQAGGAKHVDAVHDSRHPEDRSRQCALRRARPAHARAPGPPERPLRGRRADRRPSGRRRSRGCPAAFHRR